MTEYGQAFYGGDEIHERLRRQSGEWRLAGSQDWLCGNDIDFGYPNTIYRLPKNHWFYVSDAFERAKKPSDEIDKPLTDYSDDELQNKIKAMQAEIDRRKAQDDEITILARQICADNYNITTERHLFIKGERDDWYSMKIAQTAIIAGMELQKGRET